MEKIINRIIEIDKQTKSLKLETEEIINKEELNLKETLHNLEKENMMKTKGESEEIYGQIIIQGKEEAKKLANKDIELLNNIDNKYNSQKEELTEKIFENLFLAEE